MAKIGIWKLDGRFYRYCFYCPGCKDNHYLNKRWKFNGDLDRPTFTPSLLSQYNNKEICHSYITDGKIRFLTDCTHHLKGQTVELPEYPDGD